MQMTSADHYLVVQTVIAPEQYMSKRTYTVTAQENAMLLCLAIYIYILYIYISIQWVHIIGYFSEGLYFFPILVLLHALEVLQYPDCCCFRKGERWKQIVSNEESKNYQSQPRQTCDASSAVRVRIIWNALDTRQSTALHGKTTIICCFLSRLGHYSQNETGIGIA